MASVIEFLLTGEHTVARDVVLGAITASKATLFPGVPTLYNAINNHPDTPKHDLTSIRACKLLIWCGTCCCTPAAMWW